MGPAEVGLARCRRADGLAAPSPCWTPRLPVNLRATVFTWMTGVMPDKSYLELPQVGRACTGFAAIEKELDFFKAQFEPLPARKKQARLTLLAMITRAALVSVGIEARLR